MRVDDRPRFRRLAWGTVLVVFAVHLSLTVHRRSTHAGDFDRSRELGRRFLAGEPLYAEGLHYPYPPSAAMCFAPLALVGPQPAFLLRYVTAIVALSWTLHLLGETIPRAHRFGAAALTLGLAAHYLIRDFDDGGPHVILLALLVSSLVSVQYRRDGRAALLFGLATALKPTAVIFIPFFFWKREFRVGALCGAAAVAWALAPAVWMGPSSWLLHERQWAEIAIASTLGHPIPGAKESEERTENQALRPVAGRLASLSGMPAATGLAGDGAVITLVTLLALWSRRAYAGREDPRRIVEWSAVLIGSLLLSPVTWVQHLVLVCPALHRVSADWLSTRSRSFLQIGALALYALLALVLNREILGKPAYLSLLGIGSQTIAVILVLAMLMLRSERSDQRLLSSS